MLSGVQHFLFCRRQWALIHIENLWAENLRTTEGEIMHERTHNEALTEKRGNTVITRGMSVFSRSLGVSGKCDVLEFHRDDNGVPINGWEGLWLPFPVEYKRGEPKENNCDAAQLCAQALCLEEMLCCEISQGALFYGETRRRLPLDFTPELKSEVKEPLIKSAARLDGVFPVWTSTKTLEIRQYSYVFLARQTENSLANPCNGFNQRFLKSAIFEMHELFSRGHTPRVKPSKACNACSLKELCLPVLMKNRSVKEYLEESL